MQRYRYKGLKFNIQHTQNEKFKNKHQVLYNTSHIYTEIQYY